MNNFSIRVKIPLEEQIVRFISNEARSRFDKVSVHRCKSGFGWMCVYVPKNMKDIDDPDLIEKLGELDLTQQDDIVQEDLKKILTEAGFK